MGFVKKLIRPRVIIWAAVSIVLAGVVIAANLVAMKKYKGLLEGVLGYDTPILKKGDNGIPFEQEFTTKEEARENGNKVVQEICEEGMVLLKNENNALPLKANAKVSVFGKNSVNLVYGGSGSAAPGGNIPKKTLYESLADAGIAYNPTLKSFYDDNSKSGSGRGPTPDLPAGGVGTYQQVKLQYLAIMLISLIPTKIIVMRLYSSFHVLLVKTGTYQQKQAMIHLAII